MKSAAGRIGFGLAAVVVALVFATSAWFDVKPAQAATQASGLKEEVDLGAQLVTTTTDPVFLSVPLRARHVEITVKSATPVCFSANAVAPNPSACGAVTAAACPGEWAGYSIRKIANDEAYIKRIRVVSCDEGAATFKAHYSGDWRP